MTNNWNAYYILFSEAFLHKWPSDHSQKYKFSEITTPTSLKNTCIFYNLSYKKSINCTLSQGAIDNFAEVLHIPLQDLLSDFNTMIILTWSVLFGSMVVIPHLWFLSGVSIPSLLQVYSLLSPNKRYFRIL
jgi:hypothetical protein